MSVKAISVPRDHFFLKTSSFNFLQMIFFEINCRWAKYHYETTMRGCFLMVSNISVIFSPIHQVLLLQQAIFCVIFSCNKVCQRVSLSWSFFTKHLYISNQVSWVVSDCIHTLSKYYIDPSLYFTYTVVTFQLPNKTQVNNAGLLMSCRHVCKTMFSFSPLRLNYAICTKVHVP